MDITSSLIFAFTIIFSPFSAIIAYIITYDEYQHHFDKKTTRRRALQMAIFTFIVFIGVGLLSGFIFRYISTH